MFCQRFLQILGLAGATRAKKVVAIIGPDERADGGSSRHHDPLFITVPLGFKAAPMAMDCPNGLVCVDHPGTIDVRRLEPALKPLYPQLTAKQLRHALAHFPTPGHEHCITTRNGGKPEWWGVRIVGVTSRAEYQAINHHKSAHYLRRQVKANKTTGVIPTNLFLYFGVK